MASYATGDVVLLEFPFTDTAGSKRRPALILLDTGDDDIVVARVTGQLSAAPQDVTLDEWQQAGLLLPSVVRLHKVATLQRRLVDKKLGRLTPGGLVACRPGAPAGLPVPLVRPAIRHCHPQTDAQRRPDAYGRVSSGHWKRAEGAAGVRFASQDVHAKPGNGKRRPEADLQSGVLNLEWFARPLAANGRT